MRSRGDSASGQPFPRPAVPGALPVACRPGATDEDVAAPLSVGWADFDVGVVAVGEVSAAEVLAGAWVLVAGAW
jgi:hypothetical protein